jgi:uncharacterized membrane protein
MIFGKKTLFSLLLGLGVLANILELTHVNFLYTSTLISFCTCILLPGFLISLILRIRKISFWENLLIIVGLSIAFLEFGGLLLNILLPLFGVNDPLTFQNLVIGFDIYILLLFILAWIRTKQLVVRIQLPRHSKIEKVMYALPVFFPILATLGAIILNNGGSDILTLILLGTIALYSLLLIFFRDKMPADLFPYAIFFIGIACLFTTSLRSWYITGHDIVPEFYVFQLTNTHHIWNMAFYQDAYNACLSITILPTILTNLLTIQDMYVYKVIFQVLFATSPVLVFFILRNYTTPVFAFLSAFLFISFPTFINDMAWINRQEVGFIFFGLVLYMMLKRSESQQPYTQLDTRSSLSLTMRRILFVIFALGVIVSHYSTNFVLLTLLAFIAISKLLISLPFVNKTYALLVSRSPIKPKNTFPDQKFLSLPVILPLVLLFLFSMTYVWNNFYTHTSNHADSVIAQVVGGIFVHSNTESNDLSYSILFAPKVDPQKDLQNYIKRIRQSEESENLYSKSITDTYPTYPLSQEQLSPAPYGLLLSSFGITVFKGQAALRTFFASIIQIFVFIGLLALFFLKAEQKFDLEYVLLCFGALFLLALITVLPAISLEYGELRLFQQLLFVLSLLIVLGLKSTLFFMEEHRRILFTGIIAIFFFLDLTGFIPHLTGDYYPQMTLDNAGLYYDTYYVQGSDVVAMVWLSANEINNDPIVADSSDISKLLAYGYVHALDENFPASIPKNAYVFLKVSGNSVVSIDHNIIYYNSDKPFLDKYKNLIYSNGENNIYK